MKIRFGVVGVDGAPRPPLAAVAIGYGLVLVGTAVLAVLAIVAPGPGNAFVAVFTAVAVLGLLVAGALGIRAARVARSAIGPAGADVDRLAYTLRGTGAVLTVAFLAAIWAPTFAVIGVPATFAPGGAWSNALIFGLVATALLASAQVGIVYGILAGPGYRVDGIEPGGDDRWLDPGSGTQVRRGQGGVLVTVGLMALMAVLLAAVGVDLFSAGAGSARIGVVTIAYVVGAVLLVPLGWSAILARRTISGDRVYLPGLHRAVRPVRWCAAATVVTVPAVVLAIGQAAADPERPLLFVPVVVLLPAFAVGLQLLTLTRLYLGDVPVRRRRGRR